MEVKTNIEKKDLIYFNLTIIPKLRSTYITIIVLSIFMLAFLFLTRGIPSSGRDFLLMLIISTAGGFIGVTVSTIFSILTLLVMSSKKNGVLGQHIYRISEDGLYESTSANEGLSKWTGITKVEVVGSYLLFQISGYLFHIVPARSFPNENNFRFFAEKSLAYWKMTNNDKKFK